MTRINPCGKIPDQMARSKYSPAQKAEAVALAAEHGIAHAHRETEIPKQTLSRWASDAGIDAGRTAREKTARAVEARVAAGEERRTTMVHEMGAVAHMALARVEHCLEGESPDGRGAKDFALTMAILVDKAQLLSGGATNRYGTDADRERALSEARERGLHLVPEKVA